MNENDLGSAGDRLHPQGRSAICDPQAAAFSSAYVSAFNDYARRELLYGHPPIPQSLQSNIEYRFYESGHMVYAKGLAQAVA